MKSLLKSIVTAFAFSITLPFLVLFIAACELLKLIRSFDRFMIGEPTTGVRDTHNDSYVFIHQRGWRRRKFHDGSPEKQPVRELNLGDFPSRWPLQAKRALSLLPFRVNPFTPSNEDIYEQLMSIPCGWERLAKQTTRRVRNGDYVLVTFKADDLEVCIYCVVSGLERCTNAIGSIFSGYIELTPITSDFVGPFGWLKKWCRTVAIFVGLSWLWQPNGYVLPENWPAANGENSWLCNA